MRLPTEGKGIMDPTKPPGPGIVYAFFGGLAWISESGSVVAEVLDFAVRGVCVVWLFLLLIMFGFLLVLIFKKEVQEDMRKHGWDWDD